MKNKTTAEIIDFRENRPPPKHAPLVPATIGLVGGERKPISVCVSNLDSAKRYLAGFRGLPVKPLPVPDLTERTHESHLRLAELLGLDPRYSLEAQGME